MSKRLSGGQKNTLLNYFQSPTNSKPKQRLEQNEPVSIPKTPASLSTPKRPPARDASSDDEETITPKQKKRVRAVIDSDSDSENTETQKKTKRDSEIRKNPEAKAAQKPSDAKSKLNAFVFDPTRTPRDSGRNGATSPVQLDVANAGKRKQVSENAGWLHERQDWMHPDKVRDANGRKANDPDYDPRTLHVPTNFIDKQTPAMKQWWTMKAKHFDTVLFFKVGKFYELYHMDAVIGVQKLGFSYMKGEFAHSGFPETAYAKMASTLVRYGYKVGRVEQTETPEMMTERSKTQKGKKDKVVTRELCQVMSTATCVYTQQMLTALAPGANYLMAVVEKRSTSGNNRYGVTFVDTSIGIFNMADFQDDKHSSRLLALLAQHPPVTVLVERGLISKQTMEILSRNTAQIKIESLTPESQFFTAEKTITKLQSENYFKKGDKEFEWPELFRTELLDGASPNDKNVLALKSLGGILWYLKECMIDIQVFSMGQFQLYIPLDIRTPTDDFKRDSMILDAMSIANLNLLGPRGSLECTLDRCSTAFGKRLLLSWICRPLADVQKIKYRQEAVQELVNNFNVLRDARDILAKMPDLERQIMKFNTFGSKLYATNHPDSRAVMYEMKSYTKRKITDLLKTLVSFERAMALIGLFATFESRMIVKLTQLEPAGGFVDVTEILDYFKTSFNQEEAATKGLIIPKIGDHPDYDNAMKTIDEIQEELDEYLQELRKKFGNKVVYWGTDKKRYQIEMPDQKNVPLEYQLEGTKKGYKRYSTAITKNFLARMMKAENARDIVIADLNRRIFEKFCSYYPQWERVTQSLMVLDVICSLADYASNYHYELCMPTVLPFSAKPMISIENGRHPCINNVENFVPNTTKFNVEDVPPLLLLTGPNMGGKSTLMRQVALISIMAQIGSFVPADSATLTCVDRLFTRLGARDDIVRGESTFLTEMTESATILRHATVHSLLLVDELGRGTSTHDGTAIATAYVRGLMQIGARAIFSTHYHSLVDEYVGEERIQVGHMACLAEQHEDGENETVTFLYRLDKGQCPKSYGFNVARLAGLPKEIVSNARAKAAKMENTAKSRKLHTELFSAKTVPKMRALLRQLKQLVVE